MLSKNFFFNTSAVLALFIGLSFVAEAVEPIIPYNSTTNAYEISTIIHLERLAEYVADEGGIATAPPAWTSAGKTFILMDDITGFSKPIGTLSNRFKGTFDGNGKKITVSINATDPTVPGIGVFGYTEGAVIKNLTVAGEINYSNASASCVGFGGIVGFGSNTDIINCTNLANITASGFGAIGTGGIAGMLSDGVIEFCSNAGNITVLGNLYTGGIVGHYSRSRNYSTSISNCVNIGTIKGIGDVGGIAGRFNAEYITDCANAGWVSGSGSIGGIIGTVVGASFGMMQNCLNTGVVQGNANFHSLIGYIHSSYSLTGRISNCYYDNQMSIYNGVYGMADATADVQGLPTNELTGPAIRNALGSAWSIYPSEGMASGYSYPFVNATGNNYRISSVAAAPVRLSNGNFWKNVSSVIQLDELYVTTRWEEAWPGGPLHEVYLLHGGWGWEAVGNLVIPPKNPNFPIQIDPYNSSYISVHNPSGYYGQQSELIASLSDGHGGKYKKNHSYNYYRHLQNSF